MSEKVQDLYVQSQRKLLCSLLYDNTDIHSVLETLTVDDFSEPLYATIFDSFRNIIKNNLQLNPVTLASDLEERGFLSHAGGTSALVQMWQEGETYILEAPISLYVDKVRNGAVRASIKKIMEEKKPFLEPDSGETVSSVVDSLAHSFNKELFRLSTGNDIVQLSSSMDSYLHLMEERKERSETSAEKGLQGIPTPLPSLNKYLAGWCGEKLITVGARTGIGKSLFAVNCATAAAAAGYSVLFFSLEMSAEELTDRLVSSITQINQNRLATGFLNENDKKRLEEFLPLIKTLNIQIDPTPETTIDAIRAKALQKKQSPEGLDFLIIDYLQLINPTPGKKFGSRQEQVADLSRSVKLLAKQLHIPIMILAQLNREKNSEEDSTPVLDNIRESGAIAQDSDIVIFLHRENKETLDETEPPKTKIILSKNRGGVSNRTIMCHSYLSTSTFTEISHKEREEHKEEESRENEEEYFFEDSEIEEFFTDDAFSFEEEE